MTKYKTLGTVAINGKNYEAGESVELDQNDAAAAALVAKRLLK